MVGGGGKGRYREMQAKHTNFNPPAAASSFPSCGLPIVVHCSARAGRSGTFCMLDYCVDELPDQQKVNMQGVVRKLQMQRTYVVDPWFKSHEIC